MDDIANRDVLHAEWQQHLHALGSKRIDRIPSACATGEAISTDSIIAALRGSTALADSDIGNLPVISCGGNMTHQA
jgi:hypothetical protein